MSYPIYIDDRAGSRDLMSHLTVPAELTRIEYGDAMVIGNGPSGIVTVGVEVKSISDLLQSMNTGRLQGRRMDGSPGQIQGMLESYDHSWLLYYGVVRPGDKNELQVRRGKLWANFRIGIRPVPYTYLEGFLLDVASTGVNTKHVYDLREAAKWLEVLHRWWSKAWSDHKGFRVFNTSQDVSIMPGLSTDEERMARVAACLPGIGFERAVAVAAYFDTIDEMVFATEAEWGKVPGIGKVLAKSVVTAIQQKVR